MLRLRAACYWLSAWQQSGAVHHDEGRRGSVRVRVRVRVRGRARVSARVTVSDRDRI